MDIKLRNTELDDLDFVLQIEFADDNRAFIAQWERSKHEEIMSSDVNYHFIIENSAQEKLGYMILYDLTEINLGYYLKRIALSEKSRGNGRKALQLLIENLNITGDFQLAVVEKNIRAIKSYQSVGFRFKSLNRQERKEFKIKIDDISEDCLVMEYCIST